MIFRELDFIDGFILLGGYLMLLGTSGILVNYIISRISSEPVSKTISKEIAIQVLLLENVRISLS